MNRTLVLTALLLTACDDDPTRESGHASSLRSDLDTLWETLPAEAPPTTSVWSFTSEEVETIEVILEGLEGEDEDAAEEMIAGLWETIPEGEYWSWSLGTAPLELLEEAGMPAVLTSEKLDGEGLTEVCMHTSRAVSCQRLAGNTAATPGAFKNICAQLSTAFSLVYKLGGVAAADVQKDLDKDGFPDTWSGDFINALRKLQDNTDGGGTLSEDLHKAYEKYGFECDDTEVASADNLKEWCAELIKSAEDDDCHLGVVSNTHESKSERWGHDMFIGDVSYDADKGECVIEVIDTSVQGSGTGDDISIIPGEQTWRVSASGTGTTATIQTGSNGHTYFTSLDAVNLVDKTCCGLDGK